METISFKKQYNHRQLHNTQLDFLLDCIQNGTWNELVGATRATDDEDLQKDLKAMMPLFFTFQFTELNQGAGKDVSYEHRGLMPFDIDGIPKEKAIELKQKLLNSNFGRFIRFIFFSPRFGLKFALQTSYRNDVELFDVDPDDYYNKVYKKIQTGIEKTLGVKLDDSCCNRNRGTYISYDPELYRNPKPDSINLDKQLESHKAEHLEKQKMSDHIKHRVENSSFDLDESTRYMDAMFCKYVGEMSKGNRHALIFKIGLTCYQAGLSTCDCEMYFNRLKSSGQYTESMSPNKKANEIYSWWSKNGSFLNPNLRKTTQTQRNDIRLAIVGMTREEIAAATGVQLA